VVGAFWESIVVLERRQCTLTFYRDDPRGITTSVFLIASAEVAESLIMFSTITVYSEKRVGPLAEAIF
jgi:hypothetical protein